eukprot:CAMPEP_0185696770 /NCGR_PEP_ID=MMETSP1164-20130828/5339_1 /TAXON_ID=1104430 /ORGANISM="Chrysoreinhardia sp, Strain CCMP2950" /LENGTH=357 /DNA_ID=CAMNT_0028363657 /DNA_START=84 /DNA_END=1153 /DNA_ORIENTATION=+
MSDGPRGGAPAPLRRQAASQNLCESVVIEVEVLEARMLQLDRSDEASRFEVSIRLGSKPDDDPSAGGRGDDDALLLETVDEEHKHEAPRPPTRASSSSARGPTFPSPSPAESVKTLSLGDGRARSFMAPRVAGERCVLSSRDIVKRAAADGAPRVPVARFEVFEKWEAASPAAAAAAAATDGGAHRSDGAKQKPRSSGLASFFGASKRDKASSKKKTTTTTSSAASTTTSARGGTLKPVRRSVGFCDVVPWLATGSSSSGPEDDDEHHGASSSSSSQQQQQHHLRSFRWIRLRGPTRPEAMLRVRVVSLLGTDVARNDVCAVADAMSWWYGAGSSWGKPKNCARVAIARSRHAFPNR